MELVAVALTVLLLVTPSYQLPTAALKDILVPPIDPVNTYKRESPAKDLNNLIQQTLAQHGRVLDEILKKYEKNEVLVKKMMDHVTLRLNESKLDKIEVFLPNRRSSVTENNASSTTAMPKRNPPLVSIVRFGMHIRRYGKLFADIISDEIKNQLEPILDVISSTEASAM